MNLDGNISEILDAGQSHAPTQQDRDLLPRHPEQREGHGDESARLQALMLVAEARRNQNAGLMHQAEAGYRAALEIHPDLPIALQRLAELLLAQRHSREAIEFDRLIAVDRTSATAHHLRGVAHANLGDGASALAAFLRVLALDPDRSMSRLQAAVILRKLGQTHEALVHLELLRSRNDKDPTCHLEYGVCLTQLGFRAEARAAFAEAARLHASVTYPATGPAAHSALMIWAPGHANTPIQYLCEGAPFDCRLVAVSEETEPNTVTADVVLNLVADADQSEDLLQTTAHFLDTVDAPVLNLPRRILLTRRDIIAERLSQIDGLYVPRTLRVPRSTLMAPTDISEPAGFSYPCLVRAAGTHGGHAFERVDSHQQMALFVMRHVEEHYYLTEFVDYRSVDGYFRKYRVIVVDDTAFPYHLAIHDDWKIHHFRTRMEDNPWMQQEEARFLISPESVFTSRHYAAFHEIAATVHLDLFGIDCAVDREGKLVLFEVNACVLIEPDDSGYSYRQQVNSTVKQAFWNMLHRRAREVRQDQRP